MRSLVCAIGVLIGSMAAIAADNHLSEIANAKRVIFLGDSITYSGEYVEFVETYVRIERPNSKVEIIDLGLPSETVSGLSEPGHAGGSFPRPDLHERLERVLEKTKPNVALACYGMNDGIYYPFGEERFESFKEGMQRLRERAAAAGAKVIHITPPTFDPAPLKGRTLGPGLAEYRQPFDGYNDVLDRYSRWLLDQRNKGWEVIDAHTAMNEFIEQHRARDPKFFLAADGVHANVQGHWLIAREILRHLGAPEELVRADEPSALAKLHPREPDILKLVQKRQRLLKDAWLNEIGHKRPGMSKGKPLPEAEREAALIGAELADLLTKR